MIAWLGSIAYTFQIYFDFSGYSDMAIGLGRMFGFHFNENFNLPYVSRSVSEFWRRWHISLSSWFRDYVYIPLGGNRRHVYRNLAIVFLLTGIWHGASWHFVAWGVWNGIFILAERVYVSRKKTGTPYHNKGISVVSHLYTLLVVHFGWILFRADHTRDAVKYLAGMFGLLVPKHPGYTIFWYLDRWTVFVLLLAVLFSGPLPGKVYRYLEKKLNGNVFLTVRYTMLLVVLFCSMLRIVSGTYNPFIYFQF